MLCKNVIPTFKLLTCYEFKNTTLHLSLKLPLRRIYHKESRKKGIQSEIRTESRSIFEFYEQT